MKKSVKFLLITLSVLAGLMGAYLVADYFLFDGIRPQEVRENGFQANYYAPADQRNRPAVLLLGGGQWGDYWGQELANKGYAGLSLPYNHRPGLPELPEEIPLEYFEKALHWLARQPAVNPRRIVVMGASRNAELALLLAATYPQLISGVVAYAPSAVTWSNTVMPFNSASVKPSWTLQGRAVPFLAMPRYRPSGTGVAETLPYWQAGLADSAQAARAAIQVENIHGPVLLLSGLDDQVWPSAAMADLLAQRLRAHRFAFPLHNVQYPGTGHLISGDPDHLNEQRQGELVVDGKTYPYNYGGRPQPDQQAQQDAHRRVLALLTGLQQAQ